MNIIKKIIKISCMVLMAVLLLCSCESMVKNNAVNENSDMRNYEKGKEQAEKNGLIKNGTQTYYYVNNEKQTGWQEINGEWYFFFDDGMVTNAMIEWENEKYRFGDDGKMLKKSFHQLKEGAPLFYFDEDGKMLHDTQKEINGKIYVFDNVGNAEVLPDYQLVFNCTFPKSFRYGNSVWSDVTIDNIKYEIKDYDSEPVFVTYWTGIAGNTYKGSNYSCERYVGWKLYDPENYVIDSGYFYTDVGLKAGERFKEIKKGLYGFSTGKLRIKGVYRLELMDVN